MPVYRVTCVTKPDRDSGHEHITHVGNDLERWHFTREEVVQKIEAARPDAFHVLDPRTGKRVAVRVVREAGKEPYLRTQAEGVWTDNLLSLPGCSAGQAGGDF